MPKAAAQMTDGRDDRETVMVARSILRSKKFN